MPGNRKLASGAILLAVGLLVTYWKDDVPPNLLALMQWLYVAFVGGNAWEHFTNMRMSKQGTEATRRK